MSSTSHYINQCTPRSPTPYDFIISFINGSGTCLPPISNPLPEPMLAYCWLNPFEKNFIEIYNEKQTIRSTKRIKKYLTLEEPWDSTRFRHWFVIVLSWNHWTPEKVGKIIYNVFINSIHADGLAPLVTMMTKFRSYIYIYTYIYIYIHGAGNQRVSTFVLK